MNVLSLRGGGIKGLIPAVILAEFERITGRPVRDQFDLLAGTSTGGILALALAAGISAQSIVDMYLAHGPRIFTRRKLAGFIPSIGVMWSMYEIERLRMVLAGVFGSRRLVDCSRVMVCCTREKNKAEFLKSWKDRDVFLYDAGSATSAAPVYFEPVEIPGHGRLTDGGGFANTPIIFTLPETTEPGALFTSQPAIPRIVDLACAAPTPGPEIRGSGIIHWAKHVINWAIDSGVDADAYVARHLLGDHYLEILPSLGRASDAMDDASYRNLECLLQAGKAHAATFARQIQEHIA